MDADRGGPMMKQDAQRRRRARRVLIIGMTHARTILVPSRLAPALGALSLALAAVSIGAVFSGGFFIWMPASIIMGIATQVVALRERSPRAKPVVAGSVIGWTAILLMVLFWGLIPIALGL